MGMFIKFECAKCGEYECNCSREDWMGKTYYTENLPESYYKYTSPKGIVFEKGAIIIQDNGNQWYIKFLDPVGRKAQVQLISPENFRERKIPYEELDNFKILNAVIASK